MSDYPWYVLVDGDDLQQGDLSPYCEHLAQALARFYMRVGLPIDIPAF